MAAGKLWNNNPEVGQELNGAGDRPPGLSGPPLIARTNGAIQELIIPKDARMNVHIQGLVFSGPTESTGYMLPAYLTVFNIGLEKREWLSVRSKEAGNAHRFLRFDNATAFPEPTGRQEWQR